MSDPYTGAIHGATNRSSQLDLVLSTLLREAPDLEAAAVVSFDGLPMASGLPASMDEDRVAAMSAALLSLGERAAQGLGRGDLSQVYVEGDNGTVFLVSADDEAVLVAVGRKGAKVGLMLFEVKQAAEAVAACLRVEPEVVQPPLAVVAPVTPVQVLPSPLAAPTPVAVAPMAPTLEAESTVSRFPQSDGTLEPMAVPIAAPLAQERDAEDGYAAPDVATSSNGWNGDNQGDEYRTPAVETGSWT